MEENFFLYIQYQAKRQKVIVNNPNTNLEVLIDNLKHLKDREGNYMFDMPTMGNDGVPVDYIFGKIDESGQVLLLHSSRGKTEFCLKDYNVKNGDTLELVSDPKAGGTN
ncbi:MAG: hypothetical protein ACOYO1_00660 [Bacteroidales bacterium]